MDKKLQKHHVLYCIWDDFFNYLTDFSYFPLTKIFGKLQDMVRTVKKGLFGKGV
jgi:hypothetical protein